MHRYKIVAQISLLLSILNLVLATPIVVREIHEARGDETVVAEDVPAMLEKSDELGETSDRPTSLPPPPDVMEPASDRQTSPSPSPDAMASPQHSSLSGGSTSSGYPIPHLSSSSSVSGYSWMLKRPPRLSPYPPPSSQESASPQPSLAGSGPSEIPLPGLLHHGLAFPNPSTSNSVSSGATEAESLEWFQGLEQVNSPAPSLSQHSMASNWPTSGTVTPSESFTTPSYHPSSLSSSNVEGNWISDDSDESMPTPHSDESAQMSTPLASASAGSLSSQYFSASEGTEGLASIPEEPPSSPPPENAKFFNEKMMKKIKIVAGVTVVGAIIAGIAGSQIKHKHRNYQDS
jgi:hypothetical protein